MAGLVALPPASVTGDPRFTPSTWNCTAPGGVPAPGETAATVAVNVTGWPTGTGLAEDVSEVAVFARFTTWTRPGDVLPLKLVLPA